jgi:hypothetical protein
MRRRKLLAGLAAGLVLMLLLGAIAQLWRGPAIGPAGYARIREGMTQAQVADAVGLPPGDYVGGREGLFSVHVIDSWDCDSNLPDADRLYSDTWSGDRYILAVRYGTDGKVAGCALAEIGMADESALGTFLRRAKQQWQEWFP